MAAVLTAKDVPGRNGFGAIIPDQPVICGDKVRYVGDAVALVAAETEKIAQRALELIEVDYEPLPAVFDPREALKEDAPKIHEQGNLLSYNKLRKGDLEKGFCEADVVLERTYQVPFLEHAYLEPDVTMAVPQADGTMMVEGPMQAPFTTRRNLAAVLGVPDQPGPRPPGAHGRRFRRQGGFPHRHRLPGGGPGLAYGTAGAAGPGAGGDHPPDLQTPPDDYGRSSSGPKRTER